MRTIEAMATGVPAPVAVPQQIVVGLDRSKSSGAALRWAATQAARTGGTLEVLVATWPSADRGGVPSENADTNTAIAAALGDVPSVSFNTRVVTSNLNAALLSASRRADLLVVGTDEHSLLAGWLHGATSQHCAAYAHCPVVVVQPQRQGDDPDAQIA